MYVTEYGIIHNYACGNDRIPLNYYHVINQIGLP